jgi:AcrR family transcriptional regulator
MRRPRKRFLRILLPKLRTDDDRADFRDRLCDAAERMFAEHGPEAVTIRQLAQAIGVSPMTPYGYFKDKDAILAAVRARAFDRHAEALEQAYAAAAADPAARSSAVGEAYVRFALGNPEAYKLMFDIEQPSFDAYPDLVRASERSKATMTLHLTGLALKDDPEKVGLLYWSAIHGPLMLHFSGMLPSKVSVVSLIKSLVDAVGVATSKTS